MLTGAKVVAQSGREACHLIGADGNDGPGPTLTAVGAHLSQRAIEHALRDAREPMPSYGALPPHQLDALVAYLASLRSARDVISVAGSQLYANTVPSAREVCSPHHLAQLGDIASKLPLGPRARQELASAKLRLRSYCRGHGYGGR